MLAYVTRSICLTHPNEAVGIVALFKFEARTVAVLPGCTAIGAVLPASILV